MSKTFDCLRRIAQKQAEINLLYLELGQIAGGNNVSVNLTATPFADEPEEESTGPTSGQVDRWSPPADESVSQVEKVIPSRQIVVTDEDHDSEDLADHVDNEPDASSTPTVVPFYVWLIAHANKSTPLAEVAKLIADDQDFPLDGTVQEQRKYLEFAQCSLKCRRQFSVLFANYSRILKSLTKEAAPATPKKKPE